MPRQYSAEFHARGVRLVVEAREADPGLSQYQAIKRIAPQLGVSEQGLTRWVHKAQIEAGERQGVTAAEHAEIRRLKRELAEARRANEILKTASAFFAAELDRPTQR